MPIDQIAGRERERAQLEGAVQRAVAGRAELVFLEGPTGSGKSTLLTELCGRIEADELGETEVVRLICTPSTPYGPFLELLSDLARRDRKRIVAKRALDILKSTAPLVLQVIPTVGGVAATVFTEWLKSAEAGASVDAVPKQISDALRRLTDEESPLVVAFDEAHLLDEGSSAVLGRIVSEGKLGRLLFVISFDAQRLPAGHPLPRLQVDAGLAGLSRTIRMLPLEEADVAAMLRAAWGNEPHPLLAAWLVERCSGNAAFVAAFIRALEDSGVVRRPARPAPSSPGRSSAVRMDGRSAAPSWTPSCRRACNSSRSSRRDCSTRRSRLFSRRPRSRESSSLRACWSSCSKRTRARFANGSRRCSRAASS